MSTARLNVNLPESLLQELRDLSESSNRSMTDIVRTGLGLAKLAYEEKSKKHRLAVTTQDGQPIKEIVIP
jgi:hypothetical protein